MNTTEPADQMLVFVLYAGPAHDKMNLVDIYEEHDDAYAAGDLHVAQPDHKDWVYYVEDRFVLSRKVT